MPILKDMDMDMNEISLIIAAIGNHEEQNGLPVNEISAALILADKSDTHRSRVRKEDFTMKNIHDRVNLSIKKNYLAVASLTIGSGGKIARLCVRGPVLVRSGHKSSQGCKQFRIIEGGKLFIRIITGIISSGARSLKRNADLVPESGILRVGIGDILREYIQR
jgi:hypothetical protein